MFNGSELDGEFYLACGRTNRDYRTLLSAAAQVNAPFVILASKALIGDFPIPPNVRFIEGPKNASTDKGIPYGELIADYYAKARAVCIPRLDIPTDTSGYTNLLESLAMFRPVIMTRTGTLNLDIEREGVGRFVAPGSVEDWVTALRELEAQPAIRLRMQQNAAELVHRYYHLDRFGEEVSQFLLSNLALKGALSVKEVAECAVAHRAEDI
jgi:glycosyltransferase involved in cell wall biosynthesis